MKFSTKKQKTNILPLRWFANWCERIANYYLNLYLKHEDPGVDESLTPALAKIYGRISSLFYKPYFKWGTYYEIDMDVWDSMLNDPDFIEVIKNISSDYDENGIPYWEKDDN